MSVKVPRVDIYKVFHGKAKERRKGETVLGDSLRDLGLVRFLDYSLGKKVLESTERSDFVKKVENILLERAKWVLIALASYFGLKGDAFTKFVSSNRTVVIDRNEKLNNDNVISVIFPINDVSFFLEEKSSPLHWRKGEMLVKGGRYLYTLTKGVIKVPNLLVECKEGSFLLMAESLCSLETVTPIQEFEIV